MNFNVGPILRLAPTPTVTTTAAYRNGRSKGFRVGAFTTTIGNLNGNGTGTIQTNASGTGTLVVTQTTDGSVSNVIADGTGY
jgi:hypothetical protein